MTIKVYEFPSFRIERQLFHVPGAGYDGGLTSGGAQFITPEPGGFGVLEIAPAVIDTEWVDPAASWIMSKVNGQVFRVRLAASPQIAFSKSRHNHLDHLWVNEDMPSDAAAQVQFATSSLQGSVVVQVYMPQFGRILRPGHVIGHAYDTYLIDEVSYSGPIATLTVSPPLRRRVGAGDTALLRPWFTGRISNGAEIRAAYDNLGHVKPGNIVLHEAILP
jgi:hypothetical protein